MSAVRQETVRPEEAGLRFDRWCRQRFPRLGHGALQKLLRTGQFRLDGKRVDAGDRLVAGQTVRVPPLPEAAAAPPVRPRVADRDAAFVRGLVLHEDDAVIVLNKPAGLAVQGGTGTSRHLDAMLGAFGEGEQRPRLVHRLDRDTSGLLVVAKSAAIARELAFAFQQHRVRKLYWAVVVGRPQRNQGEIDLALAKQGPPGRERMAADAAGGRRARTAWRVLAAAGKAGAWLALLPLTGRTHQLRAHCAALGCPIQGDGKYGGKAAQPAGAPGGLMLHAREIDLPLPGGRRLSLRAEPPPAFRESLKRLGIEPGIFPGATLADWP